MKVFLIDNNKINKYMLPSKVDDSFLITHNSTTSKNCIITFDGHDGAWYLKDNGSIDIIENNQEVAEAKVELYRKYIIRVASTRNIVELYFLPSKESLFKLGFSNMEQFSVGNTDACNLFYASNNIAATEAIFKRVGDDWVISTVNDETYKVYINNYRATISKLKPGDIIFAGGLKIIWMKNFIYVNNPLNLLKVAGMSLVEDEEETWSIDPVLENDKYVELYNKEDYFVHFPSIRRSITTKEVNVDAPPAFEKDNSLPAILAMGSMVVMLGSSAMMIINVVNGINEGKAVSSYIAQIIMCVAMILGSLVMPQVTKAYQKRKRQEKEALRQEKYTEYLQNKERELQLEIKDELQILSDNYLSVDDCLVAISKKNKHFWWRQYTDSEFLCIRVGVGKINSAVVVKAPEEHFNLEPDALFLESTKIKERYEYVDGAPVVVSLRNNNITSLVCATAARDYLFNNIITQIVALHSSMDLKIVLLTSEENSDKWEYIKYLPHVFSDNKDIRFYAVSENEAKYVSNTLENIIKERKDYMAENNGKTLIPVPYYLVITDNYSNYKNIPIIDELVNKNADNLGFSLLVLDTTLKQVPVNSKTFIEVSEKDGVIIEKEEDVTKERVFYLDRINTEIDMMNLSAVLANTPITTMEGPSVLPTSLTFLEMFNVSKIEQLNILNRWQENNPVISLETTVGVHPTGDKFKLDLHEKYHGPHGLIAGSTGSGKSEFIITWILSMALNYHPYEVQFVLIDYKGGGLAGAFLNKEIGLKLPHLVGTITNLDKNSMNRSLMSIQSEVTRRQVVFNEVRESLGEGTIDIYKYQKLYREGVVKKPMSHLFIVCDEFAELKTQQPEFMDSLISISRIGRSLGVHLILATQKPSGVVNDQIWANSKFKICLKVQDKSDSMEMLKRPEAASIKETGRFYLQVGYDELFEIGQSGWSGAKYIPSDKITIKVDEAINYINNTGYVLKSVKEEKEDINQLDQGDQLTNLVKYLASIAQKENLITTNLWVDALPEIIYISDLKNKYAYEPVSFYINPVIGEYDDPVNQRQALLNVDLSKKGNLVIYGIPGSGKENLITNLVRSTIVEHTPDEVNIYILDCGSEALRIFASFPHVGDVITVDDNEKIKDLIKLITSEIERRKSLFVEYAGSYNDYIENSGEKLPLMLIVINNYDVFSENYQNEADSLQPLFRDGAKYGVVFVVSALSINTIKTRSIAYFNNKICLRLNNDGDYRMAINAPRELEPAEYFGRGLIALSNGVYEFQTATFADAKDQSKSLRELSGILNEAYTTKAKPVPSIPKKVFVDLLLDKVNGKTTIPVGFSTISKYPSYLEFNGIGILPISYNNLGDEQTEFIKAMARIMATNSKVTIIDLINSINKSIDNVNIYNNDYAALLADMKNDIMNPNNVNQELYYLVVGASSMRVKMPENIYGSITSLFNQLGKHKNVHFIMFDTINNLKDLKFEPWFKNVSTDYYMWLGEGISNQIMLPVPNLSFEDKKINFPYMAYIVKNGKFEIIKHVIDGEVNDE